MDLGPAPAAVVQPLSAASLYAVHCAHAAGLIDPIVIGDRRRTTELSATHGIDSSEWTFHDVGDDVAAAETASSMAAAGDVVMVIKGNVKSHVLMRAVLGIPSSTPNVGRFSHVFAVTLPEASYHKTPIVLPSRGDSPASQLASCGLGRKYVAWSQCTGRYSGSLPR